MHFKAYKAELGKDEKRLQAHIESVDAMIQRIIENGGNRGVHQDWDAVDREVLSIIELKETVVSKPGYAIWPLAHYEKEKGSLDSNGMRAEGHYESTSDQGERVIIVPDAPITRVQFNVRAQVERRKEAGEADPDHLPPHLAAVRQKALADSFSF